MAHRPKTVHVDPGSELDRALEEAASVPIELERRGVRYRVVRVVQPVAEDDIWAGYDPGWALEQIQAAVGGWRGLIDADAFKAYVHERRRTANRPSVSW
ncbi:MAG TPA: hypothetical protein VFN57_13010 [Thermomicrobiaceae bacterium]|nr:hypothetical protein [Thermomicrobiaceae bacterium]